MISPTFGVGKKMAPVKVTSLCLRSSTGPSMTLKSTLGVENFGCFFISMPQIYTEFLFFWRR